MYNLKQSSIKNNRWLLWSLSIVVMMLAGMLLVSVKIKALESDISKAYSSDSNVVAGSVVSLDSDKKDYVILANSKNSNQLIGVAVEVKDSLIAINQNESENKIQVSVSGSADTIVSTINGDIKIGDYIAQSSISGVGAKALPGDKTVGIAQASFSSSSSNTKQEKVKDLNGREYEVYVGRIPVLVSVSSLPNSVKDEVSGVEKWASNLVGHKVSLARIIICGVIAVVCLSAIIVMVYSSIHNSIMAVSRNPLAKPQIFEALAQIMVMIMLVSVIGITAMYLVIRI